MKKGDRIYFNGEEFEIYHIYESGYCEIRKRRNIMLVHQTEITLIK